MKVRLSQIVWLAAVPFAAVAAGSKAPKGTGPEWREGKPPIDLDLEARRDEAARTPLREPKVIEIVADGAVVWREGDAQRPRFAAGTRVLLRGEGFGQGPDVEFSKLMIGNTRVLERDLSMFEGTVELLTRHFYEHNKRFDMWPKDLLSWNDSTIEFLVPYSTRGGDLQIQVQKRTGRNASLTQYGDIHSVWDPLTERITEEAFPHASDTVSVLSQPVVSKGIRVDIDNIFYDRLVRLGEAIYWSYDYNIGMTHHMSDLDWTKIMSGEAIDPVTGQKADPKKLFGAIPLDAGEVPAVARQEIYFDPYPIPSPLKSLWGVTKPLKKGYSYPSGYVGYVYGEGINPVTEKKEKHIGFSCASCHAQLVEYDAAPGVRVKKVIPGIPNPRWSMKWSVLDNMRGVKSSETNPAGKKQKTDKTLLLYSMPEGTGEHSMVRSTEETHTPYRNDNLFSPIAIPIITRHTPIRRALSRTEMVAGFEGSYVHSEEPDGAIGAMNANDLKALTAYMGTLDQNDVVLERVGLYRTLQSKGWLADVGNASEGEFMQRGKEKYPLLMSRIARGKASYGQSCLRCHASNFGTNTDENMMPITEVGTYFSPTLYNKEVQSIRTAPIRNLYWVAQRGLLHDGHIKTIEDLLDPERVREGSATYNRLYTLNVNTFKVPKGGTEQERALRNQGYFVDVSWTKDFLYWDYQKMRREFGPRELRSPAALSLPAAPHPWPAATSAEVDDLMLYLLTL